MFHPIIIKSPPELCVCFWWKVETDLQVLTCYVLLMKTESLEVYLELQSKFYTCFCRD